MKRSKTEKSLISTASAVDPDGWKRTAPEADGLPDETRVPCPHDDDCATAVLVHGEEPPHECPDGGEFDDDLNCCTIPAPDGKRITMREAVEIAHENHKRIEAGMYPVPDGGGKGCDGSGWVRCEYQKPACANCFHPGPDDEAPCVTVGHELDSDGACILPCPGCEACGGESTIPAPDGGGGEKRVLCEQCQHHGYDPASDGTLSEFCGHEHGPKPIWLEPGQEACSLYEECGSDDDCTVPGPDNEATCSDCATFNPYTESEDGFCVVWDRVRKDEPVRTAGPNDTRCEHFRPAPDGGGGEQLGDIPFKNGQCPICDGEQSWKEQEVTVPCWNCNPDHPMRLRSDNATLRAELEQANERIAELEGADTDSKLISYHRRQKTEMQEAVAMAEEENATLRSQLDEARARVEELEGADTDSKLIAYHRRQKIEMQEAAALAEEENAALRAEVEQANERIAELEDDMNQLADAREQLAMLVPVGQDIGTVEEDIKGYVKRLEAELTRIRPVYEAAVAWDSERQNNPASWHEQWLRAAVKKAREAEEGT